jgi:hypothetical protein
VTKDRAFDFADLTVLIALDPNDSNDDADIETIDEILARRRGTVSAEPPERPQRTILHLVPDTPE